MKTFSDSEITKLNNLFLKVSKSLEKLKLSRAVSAILLRLLPKKWT